MTDAVDEWDKRITKSNARLADDVSPELLADAFPDLEGDAISDLCNDAAMVSIDDGDTVIRMAHFREAYGAGEDDNQEAASEADQEDTGEATPEAHTNGNESPPEPEIYDEDNDDVPRETADQTEVETAPTTEGESDPSAMSRGELEAEVVDLRERVDEMESMVRDAEGAVQAVRRQLKVHNKLLVGNPNSIQEVVDPDEAESYHDRLGGLDERVEDVEAEVVSLDGVVADGSGGKVSKVHDIVEMASNRRSNEALIEFEVSDIVDATGVSRRYANDLIDGPNSLPSEYEWMHERADLKQYGELELDRDAQNKVLVIDFAGVQGTKCPVNKFTTGGD
jgi:hypothetical protein